MPIEAAPTAPTLRDSLVQAVEAHVPAEAPPPADTPPTAEAPKAEAAAPAETEAQKAERLRDEKGRFVEGKAEPKAKEAPKEEAKPVEATKPRAPRPSSWKKELEPHWDTLAPELQAYIGQREREFATGVSTYKTEADRARDVMQTIARFEPELQKHNIPVTKWLTDLGTAHHTLALGSPQDKVQQVVRIIQGYGVDAQALFDLMSGKQPQYQQGQQPTPGFTAADIQRVVDERLQQEKLAAQTKDAENQLKAFTDAKGEDGQPKYPYFEDVKGTMAGILQAGLAQDYPSAYDAAIRMPQHSNIWDALQKQQTPAPEKEAEAKKQAAAKARSQAVSVKSSTPTVAPPADGKKGLRATLEEQFSKVGASRV